MRGRHVMIVLLVGPPDCFERECEEYLTDAGENDPGIEHCSHITEQQVCEGCSTENADDEYDTVVLWPCDQVSP